MIILDRFATGVLTPNQPNILVDTTDRARITDCGLAMATQDLDSIRSAPDEHGHGTRWIAPEILDSRGTYSKEADVFSFAMVMIEVRCGSWIHMANFAHLNKGFHWCHSVF